MLPDLGDHASYIWSSYAVVAFVLLGLSAWLIVEGRSLERRLEALSSRSSAKRRSDAAGPKAIIDAHKTAQ